MWTYCGHFHCETNYPIRSDPIVLSWSETIDFSCFDLSNYRRFQRRVFKLSINIMVQATQPFHQLRLSLKDERCYFSAVNALLQVYSCTSSSFFIPSARWCPMRRWQSAVIAINPAPRWWKCRCLSGTILWCHQSIPCLVFLACFPRPSSRTPQPSPIGCHPSCRFGRIALVSCWWSAEQNDMSFDSKSSPYLHIR